MRLPKPELKKPQLKRSKATNVSVPRPQLLDNLYRDLRDRRLLLPLAGLLVALVAIPFVLGQGASEPISAAEPAVVSGADATAVEPAVLAEVPTVRNYKQRLEDLKETDPFAPVFKPKKPPKVEPDAAASSGSGTALEPAQVDALNAEAEATAASSSGSSVEVDPRVPGTQAADEVVETVDEDDEDAEIRFFSAEIDVEAGEAGQVKEISDVRYLDYLPGKVAPVLTFLGFGDNTGEAVFLVSPSVTEMTGDGECAPKKPAPCQFLTLKVGDSEKFLYGNQSKTFMLKLLDTRVVEVADPRER